MSRILAFLGLGALIAALTAISTCYTSFLSDNNRFLREFVNQELLSVLGVIVTITLASAANLHLELNRLESDHGEHFKEARAATKGYAIMLIALFLMALVLVISKPIMPETPLWQARLNSSAIVIVVLNLMAMADLTLAIFNIPTNRRIKDGAI